MWLRDKMVSAEGLNNNNNNTDEVNNDKCMSQEPDNARDIIEPLVNDLIDNIFSDDNSNLLEGASLIEPEIPSTDSAEDIFNIENIVISRENSCKLQVNRRSVSMGSLL